MCNLESELQEQGIAWCRVVPRSAPSRHTDGGCQIRVPLLDYPIGLNPEVSLGLVTLGFPGGVFAAASSGGFGPARRCADSVGAEAGDGGVSISHFAREPLGRFDFAFAKSAFLRTFHLRWERSQTLAAVLF